MTCRKIESQLADLLLGPETQPVPAEVQEHASRCAECQAELASLEATRATMRLLDSWEAPEPSPFFDGKLRARLREEQQTPAPNWASAWINRLGDRFRYGNGLPLRQITAGALAAMLAIAGGTLALHEHAQPAPVQESATVRDLQSYDGNAQVFQQLSSLDSDEDSGANTSN